MKNPSPRTTGSDHPPVDEALVAARAHRIWESEGHPEGKAEEHWYRALEEARALAFGGGGARDDTAPPSDVADRAHGAETGAHAPVHTDARPSRSSSPSGSSVPSAPKTRKRTRR
ncbi:hypothetical protein ASA1KI_26470 [Opitutales bacterium ASA1]|uniref:DUF2934 domain-containing protein n=1 Tax=Congregicoccus parvus TaxID=3081749 RepID=UPI002B2873D4|nr:hypothetical protein ASA1KI_26470 [Opitutales bacterium ASA1]